MEVADVGFHVGDLLAVENRLDVEHAVRRRVVRTDIDDIVSGSSSRVVVFEWVRLLARETTCGRS